MEKWIATIAAAIAVWMPLPGGAHDIPNDVKVQAFVKPEGQRLRLLVRVPMAAMREADIPVRGPGYLDLQRAGPALATAANLWLADNIDVHEAGTPLPRGNVVATRVSIAADPSFHSFEAALANLRAPPLAV